MTKIDTARLFANETPDISDKWEEAEWTEISPGTIAAFYCNGEWEVGFVTAKREGFGEWRVSFCTDFGADYKECSLTADIIDVFVPRALTAIYRGKVIPETVCLEAFKPSDGEFPARIFAHSIANPDTWMNLAIEDISILYPDGTALPIGYSDTKGDAEFPPIKVSVVCIKSYNDGGKQTRVN